ncbi:hypothetical protein ORJ04_06575 [Rheinheimera baltica]|uniref:Uncharacterized protein n=1 Tax=Rheinheimera baltica TaxID=67576 RepID=A0ABT9HWU7_9GAMM|nr:hypothetical protein [Rheinheimera baltica]MDP5135611.1 hypothetical protein [Rheinheimera baltica]
MLLSQTISLLSGRQTIKRLKEDQINPRRSNIIRNAILPIKKGTTIGRFTAIEFAIKPSSEVVIKNHMRLDENGKEQFSLSRNVCIIVVG